MSVTSSLILDTHQKLQRILANRQREIYDNEKLQLTHEIELLRSDPSTRQCDPAEVNLISSNLIGLDQHELEALIEYQYYNASVMKTTACILNSITSLPQLNANSLDPLQTANLKVRRWLQNLKQVGTESVNGYAFRASLAVGTEFNDNVNVNTNANTNANVNANANGNNLFIVKTPRNATANQGLIHEFVVGIFGTNLLRQRIPNFAYVYGAFTCSPPFIDNKEVVTFCNNSNSPVNYILYENVSLPTAATSMDDFCRDCSVEQFLNVYLQICYALIIAEQLIGFTHNDLHNQNVLIRLIIDKFTNSPKTVSVNYSYNDKTVYLQTNVIATMIDYGQSHVEYKGEHYGYWHFMTHGIYPRRSFILRDAYKLLMFCLLTMAQNNNPSFESLSTIVRYFNRNESIIDILNNQSSILYSLLLTSQTIILNVEGLIEFIRTQFPNETSFITTTPQSELFSCSNDVNRFNGPNVFNDVNSPNRFNNLDGLRKQSQKQCSTINNIIGDLIPGVKNGHSTLPTNYQDLVSMLESKSEPEQEKLLLEFEPQLLSVHTSEVNKFDQLISQYDNLYNQVSISRIFQDNDDISNLNLSLIDQYIVTIKQQLVSATRLLDVIESIYIKLESMILIANYYSNPQLQQQAQELIPLYTLRLQQYEYVRDQMLKIIYKLGSYQNSPVYIQMFNNNLQLQQLVQQLTTYYQIVS